MKKAQLDELKTLFFLVRAFLNEEDWEDANGILDDIKKQVSYISKWIEQ